MNDSKLIEVQSAKIILLFLIVCGVLIGSTTTVYADFGSFANGELSYSSEGSNDCTTSPTSQEVTHRIEGQSGTPARIVGNNEQGSVGGNNSNNTYVTTGAGGVSLIVETTQISSGQGGNLFANVEEIHSTEDLSARWLVCGDDSVFSINNVGTSPELKVTGGLEGVNFGDGYAQTVEGATEWFEDYLEGNAQLPTCGEITGLPGKEAVEEICWSELIFGPGIIVCGGDYSVSVSASVPCPTLIREPYPRAIVGEPITFELSSGGKSHAEAGRQDPDPYLRDYKIEIEWLQLPMIPRWDFNDYPWSSSGTIGIGWTARHTYETSSYFKLDNGPSDYGIPDLPAYQVQVETYWQPRLRESWQQWVNDRFDCQDKLDAGDVSGYYSCHSDQVYCNSLGAFGRIDDNRCGDWMNRGSGWINIDLRWYGWPTPWYVNTSVKDVTPMPPNLPPLNPPIEGCITPVPVLELQSLLSGN